jgi:transposase-like protein
MAKYDNAFKYKMIELICDGGYTTELHKEYGVSPSTTLYWFRLFISDGPFDKSGLTPQETVNLEKLREIATHRELEIRKSGQSGDITFMWVLELDKDLEEWRALVEEWLITQVRGKSIAMDAMSVFFQKYLFTHDITRSPKDFLVKGYPAPDFYEVGYSHRKSQSYSINEARKIIEFIDWILLEKFSVEDDFGYKQIPAEFHNPLIKYIPDYVGGSSLNESNKNVLPYRYIKDLRSILCPTNATRFKDWIFAQEATDSSKNGGDWFVVEQSLVDENDPDCIFRKRKSSKYERDTKGYPDVVCELWSPVVSVALLTKLLLPLRTYQVRMLDSGEMDTYKYVHETRKIPGKWILNDSPLSKGDKDNPFEKGILRKFSDPTSKMEMTGFYINTNKTADINKYEDQKGYEIPWQYEECQYWLSKLRDWQQKYNPVCKPTPWVDLKKKHLGRVVDQKILKQMGSTTFLFRNPSTPKEEHLPAREQALNPLWHKTLTELENRLKSNGDSEDEKSIRFIKNKNTTLYPLHSLRVSLITAYALEGGVPMPILSKAIAGHTRLVMTLYYTKAGISYVTDKMNQAEQNILENDKESFGRFLRDAKYEQLEISAATNDPIAYQAVINAQQSGAGIIIGDKGICPKGCFGCENGGVFVNDDTGKSTFGPVPGFPEQNCVRCRWFVTGPAFLPGLVHHFNTIGYNMGETGKRVVYYQNEIEKLENLKYDCEVNNQMFTDHPKLLKFEKLHQQEIQKNDKFANDYNATLRLVDKCISIAKNNPCEDGFQLIPVGSMADIGLNINPVEHELEQLQILCNGAEIFPETDASKAVLQRSQIIDLTLARNDKKPIMFSLSEEEQLIAGNQFMRLLMKRAGSLKDAIPYATGRKELEEIGLINEFIEEIESNKLEGQVLLIESNDTTSKLSMV